MTLHHGTCILVAGTGVLLRGPSGIGKSDLAFRMIESDDAMLVADDQIRLRRIDRRLMASPPRQLAGLIEVRGLGILSRPHHQTCRIGLVIDLVEREDVPRLPEPRTVDIMEVTVPNVRLCAFDASTPVKVAALAKGLREERGAAAIGHV